MRDRLSRATRSPAYSDTAYRCAAQNGLGCYGRVVGVVTGCSRGRGSCARRCSVASLARTGDGAPSSRAPARLAGRVMARCRGRSATMRRTRARQHALAAAVARQGRGRRPLASRSATTASSDRSSRWPRRPLGSERARGLRPRTGSVVLALLPGSRPPQGRPPPVLDGPRPGRPPLLLGRRWSRLRPTVGGGAPPPRAPGGPSWGAVIRRAASPRCPGVRALLADVTATTVTTSTSRRPAP